MRFRYATRRGLTAIELVVILGIVLFIAALLIPVLNLAGLRHRGVTCSSNLRQIGLAMQIYANDNHGQWPRTRFDGMDEPKAVSFTGSEAADPFATNGPSSNDVTAALFLLIRIEGLLKAETFICPSTNDDPFDGSPAKFSNFPDPKNLTYSFINPYPSKAAIEDGFDLSFKLTSDFAIAADINPGGELLLKTSANVSREEISRVNSPNHDGDGQNVLYVDGHVEFQNNPFVGRMRVATGARDNIYTAGFGGAANGERVEGAAAVDAADSILLPVARKK